jgi:hypothetical protein
VKRTERSGHARSAWLDAGHLLGKGIGLIFTDRTMGCSTPPYDTLNLAYRTGDQAGNVSANREVVAGGLGIGPSRFVYLGQIHGVSIERAVGSDLGKAVDHPFETFPETDGVFTTEALTVLAVLTADCLPLALASPGDGVVAMLHAGWRGTIGDITAAAFARLDEELGLDAKEFKAIMGPGIGPCCYAVDEGRAGLFVEKYGEDSEVVLERDGYNLDLFRANRINLLQAGLKEENISRVGGCTCCDRRYFSFRRDGVTGRQGAFIYFEG